MEQSQEKFKIPILHKRKKGAAYFFCAKINMNQNEISFKDINTLKNALSYSKMSVDEVLEYIEDMTDQKILSQHPYAITQNKDGRFSTYLPDEGKPGKRRKLVKADRKNLEREIIKFYKEREQKKHWRISISGTSIPSGLNTSPSTAVPAHT